MSKYIVIMSHMKPPSPVPKKQIFVLYFEMEAFNVVSWYLYYQNIIKHDGHKLQLYTHTGSGYFLCCTIYTYKACSALCMVHVYKFTAVDIYMQTRCTSYITDWKTYFLHEIIYKRMVFLRKHWKQVGYSFLGWKF